MLSRLKVGDRVVFRFSVSMNTPIMDEKNIDVLVSKIYIVRFEARYYSGGALILNII